MQVFFLKICASFCASFFILPLARKQVFCGNVASFLDFQSGNTLKSVDTHLTQTKNERVGKTRREEINEKFRIALYTESLAVFDKEKAYLLSIGNNRS